MTKTFLRTLAGGLLAVLAGASNVHGQSTPGLTHGQVPTAGQWNSYFAAKQDALGFVPLNTAGGTMTGPLLTTASTATVAGLRLPHGVAPTTPTNGDLWTTTGGLFVRINGVTVGPLAPGTSAGFAAVAPVAVTFPAGVVTYALNIDANFAVVANNLAFASIASGNLLANCTASSAEPTSQTMTACLDRNFGSVSASFLQRGASAWVANVLSGDVTATNAGVVTIGPNIVTYAKFQQVAAASLVGNPTGALANAQGVTLGASLAFSGTALQRSALTGDVTAAADGNATTIALAAVTFAKFQDVAGLSVVGRSASTTGVSGAITGTANQFLGVNSAGTALGFQTMSGDATLSSGAITLGLNVVTNAKFRQSAARSLVGNCTNATADVADQAGTANQVMRVNGAGTACAFGAIDLAQAAAATGVLQAASFPALTTDVTTSAGSLVTTIANNAVTNAKAAQMAAWTIKGNVTGSTANAQDWTINGLTNKASPAAADELILWDVAGAAIKKATVSSVSSAGSVSSIAGNTGAFTLSTGITNSVNDIRADVATAANFRAGTANKMLDAAGVFTSEVGVTFGATTTFDMSTFIQANVTLTGNITTVTFTNIKAGQCGNIRFIQDATGSRTLPATFNANFKFAGGTQPVLSTAANSVDNLAFCCSATNYCIGSLSKALS